MAKKENKEIKELEKKIKDIQADIDCLCNLNDRAEDKKNSKIVITISHQILVSLNIDGNFVDFAMIDDPSKHYNYSIDTLINDLMTKKRLMEIDLNQLKIGD